MRKAANKSHSVGCAHELSHHWRLEAVASPSKVASACLRGAQVDDFAKAELVQSSRKLPRGEASEPRLARGCGVVGNRAGSRCFVGWQIALRQHEAEHDRARRWHGCDDLQRGVDRREREILGHSKPGEEGWRSRVEPYVPQP